MIVTIHTITAILWMVTVGALAVIAVTAACVIVKVVFLDKEHLRDTENNK